MQFDTLVASMGAVGYFGSLNGWVQFDTLVAPMGAVGYFGSLNGCSLILW